MNAPLLIRCPFCLNQFGVEPRTRMHQEIRCTSCGKSFLFQNALPPRKKDANAFPARSNEMVLEKHKSRGFFGWYIGLAVMAAATIWGCRYHQNLDGQGFLLFLGAVFIVTLAAVLFVRMVWFDMLITRICAFLIFEIIAIHRLIWGWGQGMRNVTFLLSAMFIGGFIYFLQSYGGNSGDSRSGGGCGCGGCSGGCGGCGGD